MNSQVLHTVFIMSLMRLQEKFEIDRHSRERSVPRRLCWKCRQFASVCSNDMLVSNVKASPPKYNFHITRLSVPLTAKTKMAFLGRCFPLRFPRYMRLKADNHVLMETREITSLPRIQNVSRASLIFANSYECSEQATIILSRLSVNKLTII